MVWYLGLRFENNSGNFLTRIVKQWQSSAITQELPW